MARMAATIAAAAVGILIGAGVLVISTKTGVAGVLFSAVPAMLGIWLLVSGWQGHRVGDEPRCAKCGYILLHLASFHCPECGTEISAQNTVAGEHQRRWGRMAWGAMLLLAASSLLFSPLTKGVAAIPWYQYKPAGFVLDDLDSPGTYLKAITELQRRESAGGLPERVRRKLIERGLKEQAAGTVTPRRELLDYLGVALLAGHFTDQEKGRFLEQACTVTMTVRPIVAEGDTVPVAVWHKGRGPQSGKYPVGFWMEYWSRNMRIDGKIVQSGSTGRTGGMSGQSGSSTILPAMGIGRHVIDTDADWAVWYGTQGEKTQSRLLGKRNCTARISCEVVPREKAPTIGVLDSEELRAKVLAAVKIDRVARQQNGEVGAHFTITAAPCDLAFDVVLQTPEGETRIGSMSCTKGKTTGYGTGGTAKQVPAKVNVLLRSSVDVAKKTVDANAIYAGEILFRDVEVVAEPY